MLIMCYSTEAVGLLRQSMSRVLLTMISRNRKQSLQAKSGARVLLVPYVRRRGLKQ